MAKVVENPPIPQPKEYTLTINQKELDILAALVINLFGNDPETGFKKASNAIQKELEPFVFEIALLSRTPKISDGTVEPV